MPLSFERRSLCHVEFGANRVKKMNKRLVVMRHAKSSWKSEARSDHERPLNKRGKHDAPRMGRKLVDLGWQPEVVISSDSTRTKQTIEGMKFDDSVEVQFWRELYLSGIREVVSFVAQVESHIQSLLVLGHNPGWEHVVQHLSDERVEMKTATAALLEIESDDWNQAIRTSGEWNLIDVLYPREL